MEYKKLSEIAEIRLSSVDKKTNENEKQVKLCNFTDVYYNFDLDAADSQNFMVATVKDSEIKKFTLKKDDVVITKDSETREDIGISCHIKEGFDNVLLGYHCALIRPKKDIDGGYLNACLKSKMSRTYFSNQASGSGQRYTLSESGIGAVKIPIIPMEQQRKIAKLVSNINDKIRINNRINDYLQQLINDIFVKWFYQFQYPNSNSKQNKPLEHPIIFNDDIKEKLPNGWKIESITHNSLCSFIDVGVPYFKSKNYLATANVDGINIIDGDNVTYENRESRANMQPRLNSVWFAKMKNSVKHINISNKGQWIVDKYILSTGFSGLQCTKESFPYIASIIMQPYFEITKDILSHGATQESVNNDDLDSIPIIIPTNDVLLEYNNAVAPLFERINDIFLENQELVKLRDELLPLLMNGQVSVA